MQLNAGTETCAGYAPIVMVAYKFQMQMLNQPVPTSKLPVASCRFAGLPGQPLSHLSVLYAAHVAFMHMAISVALALSSP